MSILTYFNRILLNNKKPNCFYLLYNLERENKVLLLMINDDDDDDDDDDDETLVLLVLLLCN